MAAWGWRHGVFALVCMVGAVGGRTQAALPPKATVDPLANIPAMTGPVSTLPALNTSPSSGTTTPAPLATPQFRRYGVDEGVLRGSVYAVAQDRRGLMWFGSSAGLMRYDGVSFQAFRNAPDDPRSLPANQTYALYVDRDNTVWAGGISTGLIAYDQRAERFRQWVHDDAKPASLADDEVWGITQTTSGELWVATGEGLDRMRADGQGFDHMPLDVDGRHAAAFGETRALLSEADGRLWIGTAKGLYLRSADGRLHRVAIDPAFRGDPGKIWRIEGGLADPQQAVARKRDSGGSNAAQAGRIVGYVGEAGKAVPRWWQIGHSSLIEGDPQPAFAIEHGLPDLVVGQPTRQQRLAGDRLQPAIAVVQQHAADGGDP
jgi:ligand-binding sensor domain-containing protein